MLLNPCPTDTKSGYIVNKIMFASATITPNVIYSTFSFVLFLSISIFFSFSVSDRFSNISFMLPILLYSLNIAHIILKLFFSEIREKLSVDL